jgi:hypothetical protein
LWEELQNWYENAGILEREFDGKGKEKLVWNELSNKYDAPVKAINQLSARFSEIFPKVQVCRHNERDEMERKGQRYLLGVGFVQSSAETAKTASPSSPLDTARNTASPTASPKNTGDAVGDARTLTQRAGDAGDAISPSFVDVCKLIPQFTDAERQKLIELLTQSQPLQERITPEDAQAIRDIALLWWPEYYPEQMQSLVAQMYGRGAPGTKYSVATLTRWFEGEIPEVRDRITELMHLRRK